MHLLVVDELGGGALLVVVVEVVLVQGGGEKVGQGLQSGKQPPYHWPHSLMPSQQTVWVAVHLLLVEETGGFEEQTVTVLVTVTSTVLVTGGLQVG